MTSRPVIIKRMLCCAAGVVSSCEKGTKLRFVRTCGRGSWVVSFRVHLRFTEDEIATLVEMVTLAAHVASWNQKPGADHGVAAYEALEDKILSKAKMAGLGDAIEWDEEKRRHQVRDEAAMGSFFQECYDEFRNESFWEGLVIRLADRGLIREIGAAAWEKLGEEQRRKRTAATEANLWKEFSRNGIENVAVIFPREEG